MIPLRDDIRSRTVPFVNYVMMTICVLVFLMQTLDPTGILTFQFGMIPQRISDPSQPVIIEVNEIVQTPFGLRKITSQKEIPPPSVSPWMTALTCIFLHGSVMHLVGNMWFLFIFGDNVEDRLGHFGYLIFYLACGVMASLTHYAFESDSPMPTIGASGAIAGVMGAYLWLFPHAKVVTLVPFLFLLQILVIPAPVFLGLWFILQLVQGTWAVGAAVATGVAWWAHIGGFVAGFAVAWFIGKNEPTQPRVIVVRPDSRQSVGRFQGPWK